MYQVQCVFSQQLRELARGLNVPNTQDEARRQMDSILAAMESVDRFFPRFSGRYDTLSPVLFAPLRERFDCGTWHDSIKAELNSYADYLDGAVSWGAYHADTLEDIVSDANPVTWREWLKDLNIIVTDGNGVTLYNSSNCGYVVVNGSVFKAVGYHMFNLYNRFAVTRYNWNGVQE